MIASGGISGDVVDHLGQIKDVVVKLGMARNLLPQESQEENTQRRKDMQDLEMDQAKANALAGVNNVLTAGQIPGNMGQNETKR